MDQLYFNDDDKENLPIPVLYYISPTIQTSLLLHYIISEGQFETEINPILHENQIECFRYCKLIGPNNDEDSLIVYVIKLTLRYTKYQVQYFPNTLRLIYFWIINSHELFQRIIVYNESPIYDMTNVKLSPLIKPKEE